ncbi:glycosyltransferase [Weizmannia ginsengihumi]|nr:glycosyltransferase [Heyndrickxia ginsengihumi]
MLSKKEVPKWFNQIKSKPIILSVGRLEYQKGFDILINSFAKLVRMGYEGTLVILGEGSLRNELSKLISDLNIQNRVLLPGFTNPYPIMRNCDVFILSSRYEGLPTVLIEALALGQRVISTDCPSGPREILKEGKFGKLVKSESIDALTKEIKNFFELNKNYQTSSISNKDHEINKVHDFEKKNVCEKWEFLITNTLI